jgi:hypothetical protein
MISYNWNLPALNEPARTVGRQVQTGRDPRGKQVLGLELGHPHQPGASDAAWAFASWLTSKAHDVQRSRRVAPRSGRHAAGSGR